MRNLGRDRRAWGQANQVAGYAFQAESKSREKLKLADLLMRAEIGEL